MSSRSFRGYAYRSCAAAALLALATPVAAQVQDQTYSFNIPAQDLGSALRTFGRQARQQVIFDGAALQGRTSRAISGSYTAIDGLHALLAGTDFEARIGSKGEFVVESRGPQSSPGPTTSVGEVTVTAQKRNESVKQVPGSVAVVSASTLINSGVNELRDLNGLVPGLQITGATTTGEIVIRGVTTGSDIGATSALLLDGVVVGPEAETSAANGNYPQFDPAITSRIEVLKGPQGTLYGGNTLGGLLMYETRKPALTAPYGGIYVEGSDTEHGGGNYSLRGDVSAPIIQDKLGFSLAVDDDDLSGFIKAAERGDQIYDYHRNTGIRAALLWQASPDLQVQISDYYTRQTSNSDQVILTPSTPVSSLTYYSGILPNWDSEFNMFAVNANYDLHWATLSYLGSYQTGTGKLQLTLENTPTGAIYQSYLPLFGGVTVPAGDELGVPKIEKYDKYTSEVKLTSPDSGPFRWLGGLYYASETDTFYEVIGAVNPATQQTLPGAVGNLQSFLLTSTLKQVAEYGDLTYYILPQLDATAGVRVSEYQQSYLQAAGGADFDAYNALGSFYGFTPTPMITPLGKENTTVETYQASLRYHIAADDMVYFHFATGYRPGGPNDIISGSPASYGPDTTDNFEVGWKTNFWNSKGYLEVAAYDILWNHIQVEASQNGIGYLTNGGEAEIKGIEIALTLRPVQGLTLNGTFSYNEGKLTQTAPGGVGNSGDTVPNTPEFSGSLAADYTHPIGENLLGFVGASARYVDSRNTAFEHSAIAENIKLSAYTIVDLRAGVRWGAYEVTAFARNLGDDRAVLGGIDSGGITLLSIARPRTFGVSFNARF